ncbi:MAG: D-aminoacyl-tRNA deacylase [Gemmatimonadota bacterium]|nr:D-aminoacyl-tRNA deacylase [Gemmatimonadota bacterium]
MRALVQRVSRSAVFINGELTAEIGRGMLILLGVGRRDTPDTIQYVAGKCIHLRIFEDEQGKMNRSLAETGGQVLVVSQFTLYGDTRKGRRPGYSGAAPPETAEAYYNAFVDALRCQGVSVRTGRFGADMQVEIHNDGPVTLMVES